VEIVSIEENSPARRAGLRERDLIVALNGQNVANVDDIHRLLSGLPAGTALRLSILRGGERREIQVIPGEA
jgi:serine protease Do